MNKDPQQIPSSRVYGGESLQDRTLRRQQQFLDAGLVLFGTIGYRAVTVRALCKQAGLTDRYFYESFSDTEALLMAVYQHCLVKFQQTILEAISGLAPDADVRTLVQVCLARAFTLIEDPLVTRVSWLEVLGVSPKVDQLYTQSVRQLAGVLLGILRSKYPTWKIEDAEGEILTIALIGAVGQTAIGWMLSGYATSRETILNAMFNVFLGLITLVEASQHSDAS